jgi:hypothetical protein
LIIIEVPSEAKSTPELDAAKKIRDSVASMWRDSLTNDSYQIRLFPNAFCPGQKRSEMDLILVVECPEEATYAPTEPFVLNDGRSVEPDRVVIRSMMACLEIKEHSASHVQFRGTEAWVQYNTGWSSATAQAHEQTTSIASFLKRQGLYPPLVRNAIWLANVHPHETTVLCGNVVLANLRWDTLLQALLSNRPPRYSKMIDGWVVDDFNLLEEGDYACDQPQDIEAVFVRSATPSELDGPRVNRLSQESSATAVRQSGLDGIVGSKLLRLRGAGGTGKTVLLLQLARHLYESNDARIVLLTYNRTLVAEITRLLSLLRLDRDIAQRTIAVQTVHSFLWETANDLCGAQEVQDDADFNTKYENVKTDLLEMLRSGALTQEDVRLKRDNRESVFFYDHVFIDEGQDFPDDERDLLVALFGHENLVVSEGAGQLVRRSTPTDWRGNLKKSEIHVHTCMSCLRMKANIARFAVRFAEALGVGGVHSVPQPNHSVPGGHVIIVEGDYFSDSRLHEELTTQLRAAKNAPVDHLFCVPPGMVEHSSDGERRSTIATVLEAQGLAVWDAVGEQKRGAISRDLEACRVVTYESCRGLEGWVVVLNQLDTFYNDKRQISGDDGTASLWVLMSVMRTMDTLVITLAPGTSPIRSALEMIAHDCQGFLDWRTQT